MLRFAPSVSRDMHIQDLQVAVINYLLAKQQNKEFIVRIEDMDIEKNIEGKDGEILAILEKFALNENQLFYQSKNKHIHQHMALKLVEQKKAFACFCSTSEIQAQKELAKKAGTAYSYSQKCEFLTQQQILKSDKKYVVRVKKPSSPIEFDDMFKGKVTTSENEIDSMVILEADGTPTQDFATAIDDMVQGVSVICTNEKNIKHSAKQIHIRKMLDYEKNITFIHLPQLQTKDAQQITVKSLLAEGFLPDAIINYLILLSCQTPVEVFNIHDALQWFDIKKCSIDSCVFEIEKLRELNKAHIQNTPPRMLSKYFGFSDEAIGELAKLYTKDMATLKEIDASITAIFRPKDFNHPLKETMLALQQIILKAPIFEDFSELTDYLMQQSSLTNDEISKPLQLLLTNKEEGPDLSDIYPYIKGFLTQIVR